MQTATNPWAGHSRTYSSLIPILKHKVHTTIGTHSYKSPGKGKHSQRACQLWREPKTFNVGDKWKDSCPTACSKLEQYCRQKGTKGTKVQQRPGSPRSCCAARVGDLRCLPARDHMPEAFTIQSLTGSSGQGWGCLRLLGSPLQQCSLALQLHPR